MEFSELVATVVSEGGFDQTSSGSTTADIKRWLNDRYRRMVAGSGWRKAQAEIATTVLAQAAYDLAEDVVDLEALKVDGSPFLRVGQRDLWDLRAGTRYLSDAGAFAPSYESDATKQVELYPTPTTAGLSIEALVSLLPVALVNDDAEPIVPVDFHEALADGAIATGLIRVDERPDLAEPFEARFQAAVEELRRRMNTRVGSGAFQIGVAGYHF